MNRKGALIAEKQESNREIPEEAAVVAVTAKGGKPKGECKLSFFISNITIQLQNGE